jgi:hypothetical protein
MRLLKSNGDTDIVVWGEEQVSQYATPIDRTITVSLDGSYSTVKVYDPLSGTTAVETLSNVSSVTLDLTDHPLIIEVDPTTSTAGTESTNDTQIVAGTPGQITDSAGNVWTLTSGTDLLVVNGVTQAGSATVSNMAYVNHTIWAEAGGNWYSADYSGGTVNVLSGPASTPLESPNLSTFAAGTSSEITDSAGNVWTLTSGTDLLTVNGVTQTGSATVSNMAYVNHTVWAEAYGSWYSADYSGGTVNVLSGPAATPLESPDETEILTGDTTDTITDHSGNVWALDSSSYLTLNGAADTSFVQQEVAYVDQTVWIQTGGNWYSLATSDGTLATLSVTGENGTTSPVGPSDDAMAMVHASLVSANLGQAAVTPQFIQPSPAPAATATHPGAPTLASLIADSHASHDVIGTMGLPTVPAHAADLHAADTTIPPTSGFFAHFAQDTSHPVLMAH